MFFWQGDELPKPETVLGANVHASYLRILTAAKHLYVVSMQKATEHST
jgi:hypothetical protein